MLVSNARNQCFYQTLRHEASKKHDIDDIRQLVQRKRLNNYLSNAMAIIVKTEDAATRIVVCCVILPIVSSKGQRPLHTSCASKPGTANTTKRISDNERLRSKTFVAVCIVRFRAMTRKTMICPAIENSLEENCFLKQG